MADEPSRSVSLMRPYQIAVTERVLKRILVSELNRPLLLALGVKCMVGAYSTS